MLLLKYVLLVVGAGMIGAAGVMMLSDMYRTWVVFEPMGEMRWGRAARLAHRDGPGAFRTLVRPSARGCLPPYLSGRAGSLLAARTRKTKRRRRSSEERPNE